MTTIAELLDSIFEGNKKTLYVEFKGWLEGSRRFRQFVDGNKTKIRNKLRNAQDDAGMKDVRAELETAELLLRAERFTLEYEKYAALKQRGPDFTVTYKTHTPFNVEVRRIRTMELAEGESEARTAKLMGVVCEKVRQMPPSIVNLLWLTTEQDVTTGEVQQAMMMLRQMADFKNEEYFTRRGFVSAADFLKQYSRLSGIVVRETNGIGVWVNPMARHKALSEVVNLIEKL